MLQPWIVGTRSDSTITCTQPPLDTIRFYGSSGNVSPGYQVVMNIVNMPNEASPDLPAGGVVLGTTQVKTDGSWEFVWNGAVPGYTLTNGRHYMLRAMLSDSNYIKFEIVYECARRQKCQTRGCPTLWPNQFRPVRS